MKELLDAEIKRERMSYKIDKTHMWKVHFSINKSYMEIIAGPDGIDSFKFRVFDCNNSFVYVFL